MVFTFRGNVGTALALDADDIINLVRKENFNKIEYVKYESDLVYHADKMPGSFTGKTFAHLKEAGTESQITSKNWALDAKAIISELYTVFTQAHWGSPPTTFTSNTNLQTTFTGQDFIADGIEIGDVLSNQYSAGTYDDHAHYDRHTMPTAIATTVISYYDLIGFPSNTITLLTKGWNNRRYKSHILHALIGDGYEDYFLTSPDVLAVRLRGVSTYKDFQRKYTRDGDSYKIKSAKLNIEKDEIYLELMNVA